MPDGPLAIGVDIGGTNLRAARVAPDGAVLERIGERIPRDPDLVIARVVEALRRLDAPGVAAVGAGIPGRVDARRREVLSGGFLDLANHRFAERIEAAVGKPVAIDNDGNMALVAEMAVGAARGAANVVMFTIGTGIGGAVALDGRILRGRAAAGQLGHLTVAGQGGLACACGRSGCVETTSSGTALRRLVAEAGLAAETTAEDLFGRDAAGNAGAAAILAAWARPLRDAIDTAVAAFDPELVLLGGGLGRAAGRALGKVPPRAGWFGCPVAPAALGDDAGMIGSGLAALRRDGGEGTVWPNGPSALERAAAG